MTAQEDLINNSKNFNILAVQEPYLDHLNNTRATSHWSVVYPARHRDGGPRTRSVILVHKSISTDNWTDLAIDDPDISGIRLVHGPKELLILNIYNNCEDNRTLTALDSILRQRQYQRRPERMQIWLGDFN